MENATIDSTDEEDILKQEEKDLNTEIEKFEAAVREFTRANVEVIDTIDTMVIDRTFTVPQPPARATNTIIKYMAPDDIFPEILDLAVKTAAFKFGFWPSRTCSQSPIMGRAPQPVCPFPLEIYNNYLARKHKRKN